MLAGALTKLLRPDGAVLAFFTTVGVADSRFSKYVILDEDSLKQRQYSSGGKRQTALQNRDIIRMFDGLKVVGVVSAEDQHPRISLPEARQTDS